MTDEPQHPLDELAAYALGGLDAGERARVETHVASCATCAARLHEDRAVVGALPLGLAPATPPPAAWPEILAAARAHSLARRPAAARAVVPAWLRTIRWPALAALVAALVVWNVTLHRELTRPGPQVEALARRPGRLVILQGTGQPDASARLFVAVVPGHGHMAIAGLPALRAGRTYQLWFVSATRPRSGATFGVDRRGRAWVTVDVPVPFDDVGAILVTEEPAPGSATPSGVRMLEARPWR